MVILFGLLFVHTGRLDQKWGKFLANLKDDREAGDYEVFSWVDEDTSRRAVEEAEQFVAALPFVSPSPGPYATIGLP